MARQDQSSAGGRSKRGGRAGSAIAIAFVALGGATGCNEDEALRAWRDAATPALETGLKAIFDGIIEGAFAAADVGTSNESADQGASGADDASSDGGDAASATQ